MITKVGVKQIPPAACPLEKLDTGRPQVGDGVDEEIPPLVVERRVGVLEAGDEWVGQEAWSCHGQHFSETQQGPHLLIETAQ